jgi:hypothetical protein
MIWRSLSPAVIALFLFVNVVGAQARSDGTIKGKVTNGTSGAASVAGVEVDLFSINNNQVTQSMVAVTDSQGVFSFSSIDRALDNTFVISTLFQDCNYYVDVPAFSENETGKTIDFTVYESTTDNSSISIVNAHTVFVPEGDYLRVQEVYVFANMSDRSYIGNLNTNGERETLTFSLPSGYSDVGFDSDLAYSAIEPVNGIFYDSFPVLPGSREVYYSYLVKPESGSYHYTRRIYYPTVNYNIFVEGREFKLTSEQLLPGQTTESGGQTFRNMSGSSIPAGSAIDLQISESAGRPIPILLWIGIAVLVVVTAIGIFWLTRRKRRSPPVLPAEDEEEQEILERIARLDDDFEVGKIDEVTYQQTRVRMKAELMEVIKNRGK